MANLSEPDAGDVVISPGSPAPELRRFVLQVMVPFAGLIVLTLLALVGLEFWSAGEANRLAAEKSREMAETGLRLALLQVGSNVTATATWDDAVVHMHLQHDQNWAMENIGNWASSSLHFEKVFIIDPEGVTRFGMIDGKVTNVSVESALGDGLQGLLDKVRATPLGEAATGIVSAGSQVVMVGAAAIHPHTDKISPITGGYSILVYGDVLDEEAVSKLRQAYLLGDLQLTRIVSRIAEGVFPLLPASGPPLAYLTWNPARPGDRVLEVVLPVLSALAIAIAVLAGFIVVHARRTAASLSLSRQLALTDSLTGLPNRILLEDRLQQAIRGLDRNGGLVAVLCLDLDKFKNVNDRYGHGAGDELLRQVAGRLRADLRSADIIARVGGDEFVVVQAAPDQQAIHLLGERLVATLSQPIVLQEAIVRIGASIGITFASSPRDIGSDLIRQADLALYDAKRAGGNRYRSVPEAGAEPEIQRTLRSAVLVSP